MSATTDVTHFTAVDGTHSTDFYTRFLDQGNRLPDIVAGKALILDGLGLAPGAHVLDMGCGTGADVFAIAERIGPSGRVVGVDVSEAMIHEARARAQTHPAPVTFRVGDARKLDFGDETFDACRMERVLMHVPGAEQAFAEIVRVTRRGGRVCVFDFDWETFVIDSDDKATTRAILRSFCDAMKTGWIGRRLPRLFKQNGLSGVEVKTRAIFLHYDFLVLLLGGHLEKMQLSQAEVDGWLAPLREASARGEFLAAISAFIVSGCRA